MSVLAWTLSAAVALHLASAALFVAWLGRPAIAASVPQVLLALGVLTYPPGVVLAGVAAVGSGALAIVWRARRRQCALCAIVALPFVALGPLAIREGWRLRRQWVHRIVLEAEPLVAALSVQAANAHAAEFARSFACPSLGTRRFSYQQNGQRWQLSLATPTMFGTTDMLIYRSDQAYPKEEVLSDGRIDGWYERVGSWAYYHDNDE